MTTGSALEAWSRTARRTVFAAAEAITTRYAQWQTGCVCATPAPSEVIFFQPRGPSPMCERAVCTRCRCPRPAVADAPAAKALAAPSPLPATTAPAPDPLDEWLALEANPSFGHRVSHAAPTAAAHRGAECA